MNFGKWIVVSFISFALFISVLVVVCVRQDVNLVSKNYYQEELVHSEKMEQIKNTNLLEVQPRIEIYGNQVELHFSELLDIERGELMFMRPSDSRLDQTFKVESTASDVLRFNANDFETGQYRVRFKWTMKGKDYFFEKIIVI